MTSEVYINNTALPSPDQDLEIGMDQIRHEYTTEAGSRVKIQVAEKLHIRGTFTLTSSWVQQFRTWQSDDSITVKCYYPDPETLSTYTCDMTMNEVYRRKSRNVVAGGVTTVTVEISEF